MSPHGHAVDNGAPGGLHGRSHVVEEKVRIGKIEIGNRWARQPILLQDFDAAAGEIVGEILPVLGIDGYESGHFVLVPQRTARVDPAGVRDERQAKRLLERGQAVGKNGWVGYESIQAESVI